MTYASDTLRERKGNGMKWSGGLTGIVRLVCGVVG